MTQTLPPEVQAQIKDGILQSMEVVIRDFAGNVISLCNTRRDHSSYGVTKSQIAKAVHAMDGAIGTYMVLAGQASHPFIASLATFLDDATLDRVHEARGRAIMAKVRI